MRFGAFVPQGWRLDLVGVEPGYPQYQRMKDCALELEASGYDSLWLYDHFHTVPRALPEATFEAWTATAALAEATTSIRLGQMCGCNLYRSPALVAKIAANVDVISRGRLEFGLGAGWYRHEVVAYGYEFEPAAVRIRKLEEAVRIVRGMWTEDEFQYEGKHYKIGVGRVKNYVGEEIELQGAVNHPKPIQKPHPPLWIAGGGEQLTLRTVARHADYSNYGGTVQEVVRKNEILDGHCQKVGRDPADITRTMNINVFLGNDEQLEALGREMGRSDREIQALRRMLSPRAPQKLIDNLAEYRDRARIQYVIAYFPDAGRGESARRFAEEIVPALR
ncbi:MAG: TIGR03560 family F420-dependent LLM class oxidoreductase [Armatimonadetes bacterium]|nr:TIGR03560 family F420-dependent LLM class oxidoreductase [Armatimonadota bacterium]